MTKKKNSANPKNATKVQVKKDTKVAQKDIGASKDNTEFDQASEKKETIVIRTKAPKSKHQEIIIENEQEPVLEPIFITSK